MGTRTLPKSKFNSGATLIAVLLLGSACSGKKICNDQTARAGLEKKIFNLEDQIENQKKKIESLQSELIVKSLKPIDVPSFNSPEPLGEETLIDSSFENLHLYFEGMKLKENGEYDDAVKKFSRFVTDYPDHVYADRAQYLILDSHLKSKEYGLVLLDSLVFENRFSESSKIPQVLFAKAMAYLNLGDQEKGSRALKSIIENFPTNPISQDAKEKLATLNSSKDSPT